jgi:hypothetical protein
MHRRLRRIKWFSKWWKDDFCYWIITIACVSILYRYSVHRRRKNPPRLLPRSIFPDRNRRLLGSFIFSAVGTSILILWSWRLYCCTIRNERLPRNCLFICCYCDYVYLQVMWRNRDKVRQFSLKINYWYYKIAFHLVCKHVPRLGSILIRITDRIHNFVHRNAHLQWDCRHTDQTI